MSNIKLTGHTWDTSGIYDAEQEKTQKQVNVDVSELKTQITQQAEAYIVPNLFDKTKATEGYYVAYNNGNLTADNRYVATDYIPIDPTKTYCLWGYGTAGQIAFYKKDKTYISGASNYSGFSEIPSNAAYVRISLYEYSNQRSRGYVNCFHITDEDSAKKSLGENATSDMILNSKIVGYGDNIANLDNTLNFLSYGVQLLKEEDRISGKYYNSYLEYVPTQSNTAFYSYLPVPLAVGVTYKLSQVSAANCYIAYGGTTYTQLSTLTPVDGVYTIRVTEPAFLFITSKAFATVEAMPNTMLWIGADPKEYVEGAYFNGINTSLISGNDKGRILLASKDMCNDIYAHKGFSGGCMLGENEVYATRYGTGHMTPASHASWGKIGFIKRYPDHSFSDVSFPDLGYENLSAELRDPNLSNITIDTAFLSGFATNNDTATPVYYNYLYVIDADLEVQDSLVFQSDKLFWGNTLITPDGYLLHCSYNTSHLYLMRSTTTFSGTVTGMEFEVAQTFDSGNESTVAIWDNKLIILSRTDAVQAVIRESSNLEGTGDFTAHQFTFVLHSPVLNLVNKGDCLIAACGRVADSKRHPCLLMFDSSYNLVNYGDVDTLTGYGGYPTLVRLSKEHYGMVYFDVYASIARTDLFYKEANVNRYLNTAYHPVI